MVKQRQLFYLSGIFAFIIYVALTSALIFDFYKSKKQKLVSRVETTYKDSIPIEALIIDKVPQPEPPKIEQAPKSLKAQAPKIDPKPTLQSAPKDEGGLKSLFSDLVNPELERKRKIQQEELQKKLIQRRKQEELRAQKAKKEQEERLKTELATIRQSQNDIKKLQQTIQTNTKNLQNINANINVKIAVPIDNDGAYDEFVDQIYQILYKSFNFAYQNEIFTALVTIDPNGNFSYRVLRFSNSALYNDKIIEILDRLKVKKMPPPPKNRSIDIEVNFKSES
ncbi:MAG: TonB C-terminal domain-containing protein [Helicobacter sp.]|nr:TonB C-terminal domain-containing protein [Helicobacter sp.]